MIMCCHQRHFFVVAILTSEANETSEATKPLEKSMASKKTMAPGKLVLKPEDTGRLRS